MATRRLFSREFKLETVKLVVERGVSVAQVAKDLDVHENVLCKWVRDAKVDPQHAFPGQGVIRPEMSELERLRKETPVGCPLVTCTRTAISRNGENWL